MPFLQRCRNRFWLGGLAYLLLVGYNIQTTALRTSTALQHLQRRGPGTPSQGHGTLPVGNGNGNGATLEAGSVREARTLSLGQTEGAGWDLSSGTVQQGSSFQQRLGSTKSGEPRYGQLQELSSLEDKYHEELAFHSKEILRINSEVNRIDGMRTEANKISKKTDSWHLRAKHADQEFILSGNKFPPYDRYSSEYRGQAQTIERQAKNILDEIRRATKKLGAWEEALKFHEEAKKYLEKKIAEIRIHRWQASIETRQ